MKIYIDFDDVICETAKYFTKIAKELFGIDVPYRQVQFFNLQKSFDLSDEQYDKLMEKIAQRGMETEGMEHYLSAFKYGMPPHGGLGIGMERLTMQLIGEDNVREATLFPRDLSRLEP